MRGGGSGCNIHTELLQQGKRLAERSHQPGIRETLQHLQPQNHQVAALVQAAQVEPGTTRESQGPQVWQLAGVEGCVE